ncbi:NAD(P)-dependent oxidoreductase [Demequina sp.]|uniref:NAD(P)-dependent oxidoreductase n=1 Tax=Demequina sp. TaxID=2050685 RepID=UPI0025B93D2C|nr:NAD(P)-dependent oxidoreductase [Demequina sp.]
MSQLGFLGLGAMGSGIAGRLVGAGHDVAVWNRSPQAAEPLVAAGARRANSAREALARPVSFSMLASDAAADATLSTENLAGEAGRVHVNMATVSGGLASRLAERARDAGVTYVAAPVLGRPPVAAAGKLNILAAGPADVVASLEPYFSVLGVRTWNMGVDPASANVVKIAVNYDIIHALEAIGESVALVERYGVDARDFVELLGGTLFGGVVYQGYGKIIAERGYHPPGFTVELGLKDLSLAEEAAAEAGLPLLTSPVLRDVFERAIADPDLAGADWSAIAEISRGGGRTG